MMAKSKDKNKMTLSMKNIHSLCKNCKNFVGSVETAYDCYSKKCPSTNKHLKIDGWGPDKSRKPNWTPCE